MSSNPNQILTAFADRVAAYVLDTFGESDVETIFMGGSVARGDIAAFEENGFTEIYSDIDLYIVLSDRVDLARARQRIRDHVSSLPRAAENYRIYPEPDAGVYSRKSLGAQPARPGTVEINSAHQLLFGGPELPGETARFTADAIDPTEGLYLLENRLAEIMEMTSEIVTDATSGHRRYVHYTLLKSCQDLLTAVLLALGRYKPTRAERMEVFDTEGDSGRLPGLVGEETARMIGESFTKLLSLPMTIKIGAPELDAKRRAVESVLLEAWRRLAVEVYGLGNTGWADAIECRCRSGRWYRNSRELLVLGKRMSVPLANLVMRLGRLARMSPVEVLRLSGLVGLLFDRGTTGDVECGDADRGNLVRGYVGNLDELTSVFGLRRGSVFERGRELCRKTT